MTTRRSIREIEALFRDATPSEEVIEQLRMDERKGVKKLLAKWEKAMEERRRLVQQFDAMSTYENRLKKDGNLFIAGVDEAGRGSIAGPVVAACVVLPDEPILGLNDSKQLPKKRRDELYDHIIRLAKVGIGVATRKEIDRHNVYEASKLAMIKAVKACRVRIDHLLVDAIALKLPIPQTPLVKGDTISVSIAAASIVAKVTRDRMMRQLAEKYPQYGFDRHVGYGTKEHLQALQRFGVTDEHRRSFSPVSYIIQKR